MDKETNFGEVIEVLKGSRHPDARFKFATRLGWNGPNQKIGLQFPDGGSVNTLPYFYIITVCGARVPWHPNQSDMLEEDWMLLPAE